MRKRSWDVMVADHQPKDKDQVSPEAIPAPRKRIKSNQRASHVSNDEDNARKLNELAPAEKETEELKLGELQQAAEKMMKEPLKSIPQNVNRAIKQVMDVQAGQAQARQEIQEKTKSSATSN